jgi:hypothetical protein
MPPQQFEPLQFEPQRFEPQQFGTAPARHAPDQSAIPPPGGWDSAPQAAPTTYPPPGQYPPPPGQYPPPPGQYPPPPGQYPPPPGQYPPPPGQYPPPAGWAPGASPPQQSRRPTGLIVGLVIVVVLALIIGGVVYLRGSDPHAEADRATAEGALITNTELGGGFQQLARQSFARSRGGLRVEGDFSACGTADGKLEDDGQAGAVVAYGGQNAAAVRVVAAEVFIMGSSDTAATLVDSIAGSARECIGGAIEEGASKTSKGASVDLRAAPAPAIGDNSAAYTGTFSIPGASLDAAVDVVVAQKGRAVALLITADTTAGMPDEKRASLVEAMLDRAQPTAAATVSSS